MNKFLKNLTLGLVTLPLVLQFSVVQALETSSTEVKNISTLNTSLVQQNISKYVQETIDKRLKIFLDKNSNIDSFKTLYNKDMVHTLTTSNITNKYEARAARMEKIQANFGERIRNSKNAIDRDYYKNETEVKINNITYIDNDIYNVDASEVTKLYYKTKDGKSDYESYSEQHIFTLLESNNKFVILNEEMPQSLLDSTYVDSNDIAQYSVITSPTPPTEKKTLIVQPNAASGIVYNRSAAATYADKYYNNYNSTYREFSNDCTNFISQCIKEGFYNYANGGWSYCADFSGNKQWWYTSGLGVGLGYTATWGAAEDSYNYWMFGQVDTTNYEQVFTSVPKGTESVPFNSIYASVGNPIYYHTDINATVYHNHAGIITAIGSNGRPLVDCHTNNRYHADYTLYPYLDYSGLIAAGYKPSATLVNIPDWYPTD